MMLPRKILNFIFLLLLKRNERIERIDSFILKTIGYIGEKLGVPESEIFREKWFLDGLYILAESIIKSNYSETLKLSHPMILSIATSNTCVFNCKYCYSDSTPIRENGNRISIDKIKKLALAQTPIFFLTGGEPLHHPDIVEICKAIIAKNRKLIIATNTYSKELVYELNRWNNKSTFIISIWGDKKTHDSIRGQGSFDSTIEMIKKYGDSSLYCSINCIVSDKDASCLDAIRDLLGKKYEVHRIFVSRIIATGRVDNQIPFINDEIKELIIKKSLKIKQITGKNISYMVPEINEYSGKDPAERFLTKVFGLKFPKGCGAAQWTLHVGADGQYFPCFAAEGIHQGYSFDLSLKQAWDDVKIERAIKSNGTNNHCMVERS